MPPPTPAGSGSKAGLKLVQGNWADGLVEKFDLILCNPPYVADGAELGPGVAEYEPDEALFAGKEGLDAYRALAPQLPRLLEAGGLRRSRSRPIRPTPSTALLARDGLQSRVAQDLAGRPARALVNLGLNEKRLALGARAHYISGQDRARSLR